MHLETFIKRTITSNETSPIHKQKTSIEKKVNLKLAMYNYTRFNFHFENNCLHNSGIPQFTSVVLISGGFLSIFL